MLAAILIAGICAGCVGGSAVPDAYPAPLTGARPASVPVIGGCQIFPANNPWNADVSRYPVDPHSDAYLESMFASTTNLHADFGTNPDWGFPFVVVPPTQKRVPVSFLYASSSNPGPYPIPPNAPIEGGRQSTGDRHVIVLQSVVCKLFEMFHAYPQDGGMRWQAISGAVFALNTNKLRPNGWTSADAAGLPLLPCMIRYDEIVAGVINHAMCFTAAQTQRGFIHPATHFASNSNDPKLPPMGLRLRLKASFDLSRYHGQALTILIALKKYGMFLDQNGTNFYVQGTSDPRWSNADLDQLKTVPGTALEAVQTGPILHASAP
jgi:hypothetical protein